MKSSSQCLNKAFFLYHAVWSNDGRGVHEEYDVDKVCVCGLSVITISYILKEYFTVFGTEITKTKVAEQKMHR